MSKSSSHNSQSQKDKTKDIVQSGKDGDAGIDSTEVDSPRESIGWSPKTRAIVSVLVAFHLFAVIVAPMANPQPSSRLFGRVSLLLQPYLQLMYLNHGYRFFAPEPGPGHLIRYEIFNSEEESSLEFPDVSGMLPDRNGHWPRQLYHRWFMLSETVFDLSLRALTDEDLKSSNLQANQEIKRLRELGDFKLADLLEEELKAANLDNQYLREQQTIVLEAIAQHLLERHNGKRIKLYLCERLLPTTLDVQLGKNLEDRDFFNEVFLGSTTLGDKSGMTNPGGSPQKSHDSPVLPGNDPSLNNLEQISQ